MSTIKTIIAGCGDVGQRLVVQLIENGQTQNQILAIVKSNESAECCERLGIQVLQLDLDEKIEFPATLNETQIVFLVPPQPDGVEDCRSQNFINTLISQNLKPRKIVLISTTGVYGNSNDEYLTEQSSLAPKLDRAKRRLDAELQWCSWSEQANISLSILRVASIYSNDRISRLRIHKSAPLVFSNECGFSNRIHADDLVAVILAAVNYSTPFDIFNVSDGSPSKITEFLQETAKVLGASALPEISMAEAKGVISEGMLSYLQESRKISNTKMLNKLKVALLYPDYRIGLRH